MTFHTTRLISRDDKHKYNDGSNVMKIDSERELRRIAEQNIIKNNGIQAVTSSAI